MAQTGLAHGGAAGVEGSTRPRLVVFGAWGGRRARTVLAVTIVLGLAVGVAWFGWRSTMPTSRVVGGTNPVAITGEVAVEGGPTQAQGAGSDLHPIRSAPMLVTGATTSGARVVRRFTADRQGHFKLMLPPGRYTFTAVIYRGEIPLAQEPHATVRIRPGHQPRVRILEHVF